MTKEKLAKLRGMGLVFDDVFDELAEKRDKFNEDWEESKKKREEESIKKTTILKTDNVTLNALKELLIIQEISDLPLQTDPLPRNPYAGIDRSKIPDPLSNHELYKLIKRPANAPVDRNTTFFTDLPYFWSGGDETFLKQKPFDKLGNYITSLDFVKYNLKTSESGKQFNEFTECEKYFNFTSEINETNLVNLLLGNYIRGTGPINYIFPTNGAVSKLLIGSQVLNDAFKDWIYNGSKNNFHKKIEFKVSRQAQLIKLDKIISLENFIGSVDVTINWTSTDKVIVRIYNVTSITSGDLTKHFPGGNWMPSVVADPNAKSKEPYSNILQIYQLAFRQYKLPSGEIKWITT